MNIAKFYKNSFSYSTPPVAASDDCQSLYSSSQWNLKILYTVLLSGALKCSVTVYFTKMLLVKESKNKHSVTLSCLFINKGYNNKHQNTAKYKFGLKVYSLMY